jgi:hypothetical protein
MRIVDAKALAPLIALLRSPYERLQEHACVALRNLSVQNEIAIAEEGAIPPLIRLLSSPLPKVQAQAAFCLRPLLEAHMNEGAQDEALHTALAKIYIDTAQNPEKFLEENRFYNSLVVGKYCETRDPRYSVICYKRGGCDDELIAVTSANGLHKDLAMYLIQRKDQDLWAKVLRSGDAAAKQRVVDQVVHVGLPESKNADDVSETVKAFVSADMPSALIELLETIVLQGSEFGQNKNLQNLLIITAISADATRVMGYIDRLDKFDASDIAEICVQKELYEEAVFIYKRNKMIVPAVNVLIENLKDLDRGLLTAAYFLLDLIDNSIPCSAQELAKIAAFWDAQYEKAYSVLVDEYISHDWWEFLYRGVLIKCKIPNFCGRDASTFPGVPGTVRRNGNPPPLTHSFCALTFRLTMCMQVRRLLLGCASTCSGKRA